MRRTFQPSCFCLKWLLVLLSVSVLFLLYYLDDTDELLDSIAPPNDIRALDTPFDEDQELSEINRVKMQNTEALVLMEDGRVLFEASQLTLPSCPPGVKINMDNAALDKIRFCSAIDWKKALLPPELVVWNYSNRHMCEGKLTIYDREVAHLLDVIVDKAFCSGRPCHESVDSYIGSGYEKADKVEIDEGFFLVPCNQLFERRKIFFRGAERNHLNEWTKALDTYNYPQYIYVKEVVDTFTIVIKRYEYWNLYHTISDIYNAFMVTQYFNVSMKSAAVLFLDGGGSGPLLPLWETLFGSVTYLHQISEQSLFRRLIWNKLGYSSEFLAHSNEALPMVEQFQKSVLTEFHLDQGKTVNCENLTLLMISRNDYDNRTISRKIANEKDVIHALRQKLKLDDILLADMQHLSIEAQLRLIQNTDILVGMHGAGMTHALFLPAHAAVVEFLPAWGRSDGHFRGISRWRNLKYVSWRHPGNVSETNSDSPIIVPVDVTLELVSQVISRLCPHVRDIVNP